MAAHEKGSTRERLVGTMSASLREHGYGSSAIKDVLDQANVTAGSMYHFFPGGKDELAEAAVLEVGLAASAMLAATLEQSDSVAEGAIAFYEALIADMEASEFRFGCPVGVPSTEAAATVDGIRAAGETVFSGWIATIRDALEAEGWDPDSALVAARFAICAYEGASALGRACLDTSLIRDTLSVVHDVLSQPRRFAPR